MPATIRILIVEDDPQDAALAEREVRRADIFCTFLRVDSKYAMVEALREFGPDVILTDHSLPQFSARDALEVARQVSPGTPVIIVTGRLGDESAVQYLQAGAADYIVKDHLNRLGPAVLRALDTKRSREEQARAHQLQGAIYRIAQVAMSSPGLEELLPAIHQIVGELMPARNFYIALYDAASDLLSFPYVVDEHDTDFSSKKRGKGLTEYVLRTGQPLLVTPEVQAELERRGEVELVGAPSIDWLGVPLKIGDRAIGALVAQTYTPGVRYGEREKEILQFVSTQVAMAIERSHAEADLRASEARLKAIIDAALDAVITMDGDGVVLSWSPQAERVFGWPASETVGGKLSTTMIPPRYREAHERGLAHFIKSGEGPVLNQRIEITGLRRDGREIPVELTITPVRLGGAWLFSAFVRDISERKRAEEALADRTRTAELAADVGVSLTKGTTQRDTLQRCCEALVRHLDVAFARIWTLNDAEAMLELQASAGLYTHIDGAHGRVPVGKYKIGLIAAEQRPHITNTVIGDPRVGDQEWAKREGMVSFAGFPLLVQDRLVGVMAMFARRPLTGFVHQALAAVADGIAVGIERKRAVEALARSETTYRSLVEASPFGIFRSAADGRLIAVNPALVSILGYDSEAELLEQNMATDFYVDPAERARLLDAVLKSGSLTAESVWRRKDAKPITVRQTGRVVCDAQGEVEYFNVLVEDITERKLLEAQFRQAQKMEAVGRLAGGIAHDFNNLLTAIIGYTDLALAELREGDPMRQDMEEILRAAHRAAGLTHQLLAFSRQQVLAPRVLDLNEVVQSVDNMLRRLLGEDIELQSMPAPALGHVKADPGQLEQVIVNLAVNARDAMPTGGKLTIETADVEMSETLGRDITTVPAGRYVMLAITDSGTGMEEETKARIFEPFFTTKEQGKGTGLGLATVYGIVKQSGGFIWVYSEPGHGTTFKIYLPRVEGAADALAPPVGTAEVPRGTETVLIVEDEAAVRALAKTGLTRKGYRVLEAANGGEALLLCEAEQAPIHLLVTDVVMPGLGGADLAQRLAPLRPDMKVLFISGYTDQGAARHGTIHPGAAYLEKPFSLDALARKVREVLDRG
jgi:two-component system cell cycle sensor histidine kinase/response regulator CckA